MPTRFIEAAGEINSAMPLHVVDRLTDALNVRGKALRDATILLVGVAYKRDVEDTRESSALTIIRLIEAKFARMNYYDPHVSAVAITVSSTGIDIGRVGSENDQR